jgi:hypothetical protein
MGCRFTTQNHLENNGQKCTLEMFGEHCPFNIKSDWYDTLVYFTLTTLVDEGNMSTAKCICFSFSSNHATDHCGL